MAVGRASQDRRELHKGIEKNLAVQGSNADVVLKRVDKPKKSRCMVVHVISPHLSFRSSLDPGGRSRNYHFDTGCGQLHETNGAGPGTVGPP